MQRRRLLFLPVFRHLVWLFFVSSLCCQAFLPLHSSSSLQHSSSAATTSTALMGIRGFRAWFESQFPDAMVAIPRKNPNKDPGASDVCDSFDHVLVDMNQLLHVCVRKSRSDGHALMILMKELDALVYQVTPTKSLVLALDGPPSAAKLATQRRRRYGIVVKTEWKLQHLDRFVDGRTDDKTEEGGNRKIRGTLNSKQAALKKRRAVSDTRTLSLTPGTEFMHRAEQAILYWAWQRLDARQSTLTTNNVHVYISPSTVAGEGEVKLLEWIYQKQRQGESIAILGGDSDLVLEALVIPVASTHNCFVILPDGSKRYLSVSLWETTKTLQRQFQLTASQIMKTRTDLCVLLVLNGNDYLPKLRGASGFNRLFSTYAKLHRDWTDKDNAFLVNPDSLEFNLPFCIEFFQRLACPSRDKALLHQQDQNKPADNRRSALQQLRNFVDAGYLPSPLEFQVVKDPDEDAEALNELDGAEEEEIIDDEGTTGDGEGEEDDNRVLVRLLLGKPGSDTFYVYETWHSRFASYKEAKRRLAKDALSDLLDIEDDGAEDDEGLIPGMSNFGYAWEIPHLVEGKVDRYLYGLLWNLQTYQDGICSDYSFNYGKRSSPAASEIVAFLQEAQQKGNSVGLKQFQTAPFSKPISAGLSCLAALPSVVKHLVPEPYRWLSDDLVEELYGSCMDPVDNVFDVKKFEELCEKHVKDFVELQRNGRTEEGHEDREGRRIFMNDHSWTVVSRVSKPLANPFEPPLPFAERLSRLRFNRQIRISRFVSTQKPRPRSVWGDSIEVETLTKSKQKKKKGFVDRDFREIRHGDPAPFMVDLESFDDVEYKVAYQKERKGPKSKKSKNEDDAVTHIKDSRPQQNSNDAQQIAREHNFGSKNEGSGQVETSKPQPIDGNLKQATREQLVTTSDGHSAMACLKMLEDASLIGSVEWAVVSPSVVDPKKYECVRLSVSKGTDPHVAVLHEDLVFEEHRELNVVSKQSIRQHLASLALCEIAGPTKKWSELTIKELKDFLRSKAGARNK